MTPINYLLQELSKLKFVGPATDDKLKEFKKERELAIKKAKIYEEVFIDKIIQRERNSDF